MTEVSPYWLGMPEDEVWFELVPNTNCPLLRAPARRDIAPPRLAPGGFTYSRTAPAAAVGQPHRPPRRVSRSRAPLRSAQGAGRNILPTKIEDFLTQ